MPRHWPYCPSIRLMSYTWPKLLLESIVLRKATGARQCMKDPAENVLLCARKLTCAWYGRRFPSARNHNLKLEGPYTEVHAL